MCSSKASHAMLPECIVLGRPTCRKQILGNSCRKSTLRPTAAKRGSSVCFILAMPRPMASYRSLSWYCGTDIDGDSLE